MRLVLGPAFLVLAVACSAPGDDGGGAGAAGASASDTGSGSGATSSGATSGATTAEVTPVANGTKYSFQMGDAVLEVDASVAGRVVTFSSGGQNVLTGPEVHAQNYGSTFWTSPQSVWNWPPPVAIDSSAGTVTLDGSVLSVVGSADAGLGVSVTKRFWAEPATQSFKLEYTIINQGSAAVEVAPWEVSRVAPGGLSFFAMGPGGIPTAPASSLGAVDGGGATWFDYASNPPSADQKLFADGAGWLAHVVGNVIFIKQFTDVAQGAAAPNEAEIEIFANGVQTYVELEQQGTYSSVTPGSALSWTVTWYLRILPEGTVIAAGSPDLVAFVNQVLAGS